MNHNYMKTVSILLVEDDDIDAIGIQRSLKSFNLLNPIHRTRDGLEALEVLKNDAIARPFIVLLDLNMPRMNGMEFLSAIRSDSNLSDIVVFVLTTSQLDEEISAAYKKNIAGYIVKSSSNQDYKQLIRFLENYWNIVELPKC
ncbi:MULTISPECIES: response regulator [Vibrio]|jgi:CheY-like chemotaxis protein|uniref:Two-component system response regulator n=3 Tax=Vibrio cyclitrophicus TaxID=47951 RepID=A0A7Z1S276_9VIBR|nr:MULTISPECIES: response regulator [Vibrio]MBY7662020.1 response regulator [Vibrio atlanticus]KAA8596456.1 Two-component response regulator [Vibrio cyclitrophicus]MBE8557246.1 response regulator [Vibrio sp. OPT24]MBU2933869.1 response regulator [Vibrio cyclitrophicus]MCC4775192.1 response regulator [Vibrio cyclitrophicus]